MCKDIIKIISLYDDVIEVKLELTDNIRNLLDLLRLEVFIKDWCIVDPEVIYEL